MTTRRQFLRQLGCTAAAFASGPFVLPVWAEGQSVPSLPRSRPESQGVEAAGILKFVEAIEAQKLPLHSVMIIRNGQVITEGWWAPYTADLRHTLYSLSKSFTSTAVGLAAAEGKLKLDDKVISFFPKDVPASISPKLEAMQVKHLLMMGAGHASDCLFGGGYGLPKHDWVKAALSRPVENDPGSVFLYNSGASFLLSAIVQQVTGQPMIEYLQPRLLNPLGIEGADWETNEDGQNVGGWGLRVRTEDIAKFGQLYLQKGKWGDKQLLPESWVAEATSQQIKTDPTDDPMKRAKSDWAQGYGYQFWRSRHDAYRGDGAFGQYCIVLPEKNAVVAITSEVGNMQAILDALWDNVLPAMKSEKVQTDDGALTALTTRLKSLTLPVPEGKTTSDLSEKVNGKSLILQNNGLASSELTIKIDGDKVTLAAPAEGHSVTCGIGKWQTGETTFSPLPLKLVQTAVPGETKHKVAGAAAWTDDKTLSMRVQFIETTHYDTAALRFDGDKIELEFRRSQSVLNPSAKDPRPKLTGKLS
jgi:CubicO group peptidase (beta-lactamase class C family)